MSEHSTDDPAHTLRERGARYVVDTHGQALAVLLTLEEYEHYLDLLDDADEYIREADSQDAELAARLAERRPGRAVASANPSATICFSDR